MKLKQLEQHLQTIEGFENPKVLLGKISSVLCSEQETNLIPRNNVYFWSNSKCIRSLWASLYSLHLLIKRYPEYEYKCFWFHIANVYLNTYCFLGITITFFVEQDIIFLIDIKDL